ncbi:MAG: hypothetical protein RLO08_01455 [Parvibaculaceae bacterium]
MERLAPHKGALLRHCFAIVFCASLIAAPLQQTLAAGVAHSAGPVVSIADEGMGAGAETKGSVPMHLAHTGMTDGEHDMQPKCCPQDHDAMNGGFCADCLVFAEAAELPIAASRPAPATLMREMAGQSLSPAGDAPVPKA